jgi:hypothetical protein
MKKNCLYCHFLAKEYRDETEHIHAFSLSNEKREKLIKSPEDAVQSHYALSCHMDVWGEGVSGSKEERDKFINLMSRNSGCFFFPHHPAMLFPAAQELQRREEENSQLKCSNMYTRLGLWVAACAFVVNVLVEVLING